MIKYAVDVFEAPLAKIDIPFNHPFEIYHIEFDRYIRRMT